MEAIVFIPVRGGSKSIPKKNIKSFCGKPLVYWVTLAAQKANSVDKVIISTDSPEIKETVLSFNFSKLEVFNRSQKNATDRSSTESAMLEYIKSNNLPLDLKFILAQATSPFLTSFNIDSAIEELNNSNKYSLLSCSIMKRFLWTADGASLNYDRYNRPRRQDFSGILVENGAIYINSIRNILKRNNRLSDNVHVYVMPEYAITEIDEPDDWVYAEYLMKTHILSKEPKVKNIKLVLSDVDGVLTDAGMYYSENGDELKKFNTHDGKGFELLKSAGYKTGIITSENTKVVERRAKKLKVDYLYQGKQNGSKLESALQICTKLNISLEEVAYIGDDINCYELLIACGFAACPNNANQKIKNIPNIQILNKNGGEGVFREFSALILDLN